MTFSLSARLRCRLFLVPRLLSHYIRRKRMPTITERRSMTPKSVLRHRPIGNCTADVPITTLRSSRAKQKREPHTTGGPPFVSDGKKRHVQVHWLVLAGLAMVGMLA